MTTFLPKRILTPFKFMRSGGRVMLFRSFLQLIALLLFAFVFATIVLLLSAYTGYLGEDARDWVDWAWREATAHRGLIEKAFAVVGAISTLTISALGVYKTWHFAEINLPIRLVELSKHWHDAVLRGRPEFVPELGLSDSIAVVPMYDRGFFDTLLSFVYDPDQAALRRCTKKVAKFENEQRALERSQQHCQTEIHTSYLELGSLLRRCDPLAGNGILGLFKKPLETDPNELDALELSARQALAIRMRQKACEYLVQLIEATGEARGLRHARALRFHAEVLHGEDRVERRQAEEQLKMALTTLDGSDAADPATRRLELGLAHELLAKIYIANRWYRRARNEIADARGFLGDIERLKKLDEQADPRSNPSSDPPKPTDRAPKGKGDN